MDILIQMIITVSSASMLSPLVIVDIITDLIPFESDALFISPFISIGALIQPEFSQSGYLIETPLIISYDNDLGIYGASNLSNSYELSIWTHTDSFIRLLRGAQTFDGQAYQVLFKKNIDGANTLSFSIPLFIYDFEIGELIENPLWALILGEQKIKLIIKKDQPNELIYDFAVKSFVESRDEISLIATVDCQGYIAYELNKIGLSGSFFEDEGAGFSRSMLAPIDPARNTIWIDYSNVLRRYNSNTNEWVVINDLYSGGLPELDNKPVDPNNGDIYSPPDDIAYIWNSDTERWTEEATSVWLLGADSAWTNDLFKTTNQYYHWGYVKYFAEKPGINNFAFLGNHTILMSTNKKGKIYKSIDDGDTWDAGTLLDYGQGYPYSKNNVLNIGGGIALAINSFGTVFGTINYGTSWILVNSRIDATTAISSSCLCGTKLLVGCRDGKIYQSSNYGTDWSKVAEIPDTDIEQMVSFSDGHLIARSRSLTFLSSNYGSTWTDGPADLSAWDSEFIGMDNGHAISYGVVTGDYGNTWTAMSDMSAVDSAKMYVGGGKVIGFVPNKFYYYLSNDYGDHWTTVKTKKRPIIDGLNVTAIGGYIL